MGVAQLMAQLVFQRNAWYADEYNISTAHAQLTLRAADLQNQHVGSKDITLLSVTEVSLPGSKCSYLPSLCHLSLVQVVVETCE